MGDSKDKRSFDEVVVLSGNQCQQSAVSYEKPGFQLTADSFELTAPTFSPERQFPATAKRF